MTDQYHVRLAIRNNVFWTLRQLLESGVRIDDWETRSTFRRATAHEASMDTLVVLLDHGYRFHEGESGVVYKRAMSAGRVDIMTKVKLVDTVEISPTEFTKLVKNGYSDVIRKVILHGANIPQHYLEFVIWAAQWNYRDVIECLFLKMQPNNATLTHVVQACGQFGSVDVLEFLIHTGVNIDMNDLLERSCRGGHLRAACLALTRGADPKFRRSRAWTLAWKHQRWNVVLLLAFILNKKRRDMQKILDNPSYKWMMIIMTNLIIGRLEPTGHEEWKDAYYDGNVGMIVMLYLGDPQ